MIILKGRPFNRYIKLIEVAPISFSLKTIEEQNSIYSMFSQIFNACPTKIQFITLSLPSNLRKQLEILDMEIETEKNPQCKEVGKAYKEKLINSQKYSVQHRFFIAFEYEGKNTNNVEAIYNEMLQTEISIVNILNSCGNTVLNFGKTYAEQNTAIAEILYTFYNRNEFIDEPFEKRLISELNRYSDFYKSDDFYMPITDIISPKNVSYYNSKYVVVNSNIKKGKSGTYYSFLYIPSNGYSSIVSCGWLNKLLPVNQGFDVTVYFEKQNKEVLIPKFRKNLVYNEANNNTAANNSAMADSSLRAYKAGYYLKDGLQDRGQEMFYMSTLFTVSGSSPEEVDDKVTFLKKQFKTKGMRIKECRYQEEDFFNASLPFCNLSNDIRNKTKQNILTEGAATIYPFDDAVLNDPDGIYFGENISSNSLAVVDLFDTTKYANPNVFVCGQTGAGKTYGLLLIAGRTRVKHIPTYILAPEKEHEFRRVCEALGGQFIQLGAGSPNRINVMEIFKKDEKASELIDETTEKISCLSEKTETLKNFFKLLITNPEMTSEEETLLDKAIIETYRRFGITEDNESLYDPDDFMHQKFRKMPIISDLVDVLKEDEDCSRIATIISTLCEGSASSFNGQTNVELTNDFTVIGLEHLKGKMLPLGIYMAMDYCWSKIKEDRTKKKMLFIDEWWKLAFNPVAAEYSIEIAKTIRAYGGGMVIATQDMRDIFAVGGNLGESVLTACKSKIILHLESKEAENVKKLININDWEVQNIINAGRGEALFIAGGNNVRLKFTASELEHKLITTDRKELARQAEEKLKNKERYDLDAFIINENESIDLSEFIVDTKPHENEKENHNE